MLFDSKNESNISYVRLTTFQSRDLIELEGMGMLRRVGEGRSNRYFIAIPGWDGAIP